MIIVRRAAPPGQYKSTTNIWFVSIYGKMKLLYSRFSCLVLFIVMCFLIKRYAKENKIGRNERKKEKEESPCDLLVSFHYRLRFFIRLWNRLNLSFLHLCQYKLFCITTDNPCQPPHYNNTVFKQSSNFSS